MKMLLLQGSRLNRERVISSIQWGIGPLYTSGKTTVTSVTLVS
jgi:hypothetical protein